MTGARKVGRRQVARWRWRRHYLAEPAPDAIEVARRLCGIPAHSPVPPSVALVAGVRAGGPADLYGHLMNRRTLVHTWAMRGSLHLFAADDLDLWIGAMTDRDSRRRYPPAWERANRVTAAQQHAITDAVGELLGEVPIKQNRLAQAIARHLGEPKLTGALFEPRGALFKPAAARGLLCLASSEPPGSFVAPAAYLGRPLAPPEPAAANREVLRRFLAANGPATADDVARWWGEPVATTRRWIREHADALAAVEIDGEGGFVVRAEDVDELADAPASPVEEVGLLPASDPWVSVPLSHRDHAVPSEHRAAVSRSATRTSPVLVVDGAVVGTWEYEVEKRRSVLSVTLKPFGTLSKRVEAGARWQAARYGPLLRTRHLRLGVAA